MHKPYTQKELKDEWLRRHAANLESTPIYCNGDEFVTELPKRWYESWVMGLILIVVQIGIFWMGYDFGQGVHCG